MKNKNIPKEAYKSFACLLTDSVILIAEGIFGLLPASFSLFFAIFGKKINETKEAFRYLFEIPCVTAAFVIFLSMLLLIGFNNNRKKLLVYKIFTCFEYILLLAAESIYVWQFKSSIGAIFFAVYLIFIFITVLGAKNLFRIRPDEGDSDNEERS